MDMTTEATLAVVTMRLMTLSTSLAVQRSLSVGQVEARIEALTADAPDAPDYCPVCLRNGPRCCEFGSDS